MEKRQGEPRKRGESRASVGESRASGGESRASGAEAEGRAFEDVQLCERVAAESHEARFAQGPKLQALFVPHLQAVCECVL